MTSSSLPLLPLLLALTGALLFGAQAVLARRSLDHVDPHAGAWMNIATATVVFWLLTPLYLERAFFFSPAFWIFLSIGLVHPTVSMWLAFEANKRMGPTISATISATTPLFATAGAVLTLGESLTLPLALGTLAIVFGVIALSWRGAWVAAWSLLALVFPLGAALIRAFQFVWGKYGLAYLNEPLFAATISFSMATVLSGALYGARGGWRPPRVSARGLLWGVLGGLCVAGAIICLYTALSLGGVVVVSPLISTFPMFTLVISLLSRQERIGWQVAAGVILVTGGVILISVF